MFIYESCNVILHPLKFFIFAIALHEKNQFTRSFDIQGVSKLANSEFRAW
jgi:hypothetical protein